MDKLETKVLELSEETKHSKYVSTRGIKNVKVKKSGLITICPYNIDEVIPSSSSLYMYIEGNRFIYGFDNLFRWVILEDYIYNNEKLPVYISAFIYLIKIYYPRLYDLSKSLTIYTNCQKLSTIFSQSNISNIKKKRNKQTLLDYYDTTDSGDIIKGYIHRMIYYKDIIKIIYDPVKILSFNNINFI